jgi:hypothetical protein
MIRSLTMSAAVALALVSPERAHAGWSEPIVAGSFCTIDQEFADGTNVEFALHEDLGWGSLVFWNDRWESIADREALSVTVQFDQGRQWPFAAEGMRTEEGPSRGIFIEIDGLDFYLGAMSAERMSLRRGGDLAGTYSMSGAQAAINALARCAGRLSGDADADPFAGPLVQRR